MTERSPGAPDPAEPSHSGDVPAPGARPLATPPADLSAVHRTDAIIEALSVRHAAGFEGPEKAAGTEKPADSEGPAGFEGGDMIVRLLRALVTDVDEPAARDTHAAPESVPPRGPGSGPRRRGPRTIVALGVAGAMLTSTGVAAAGDRMTEHSSAAPAPVPSEPDSSPTASNDTEVASYERPRPAPVPRPAPESGRPGRTPDNGRADYGRSRNRFEYLLSQQPRYRWPGSPFFGGRPGNQNTKFANPSGDSRRLDDSRRRTQKRPDHSQNNPYDR